MLQKPSSRMEDCGVLRGLAHLRPGSRPLRDGGARVGPMGVPKAPAASFELHRSREEPVLFDVLTRPLDAGFVKGRADDGEIRRQRVHAQVGARTGQTRG